MSRMSTGACNIQIENSQLENCMFGIEKWICEVLTENENKIYDLIEFITV